MANTQCLLLDATEGVLNSQAWTSADMSAFPIANIVKSSDGNSKGRMLFENESQARQ